MHGAGLDLALRALPHFKALPPDLLARVAAITMRSRRLAGDTIFHEGDACRAFFAIETGGVKLYRSLPDGREQVVHTLRAGSTFAEAAFLAFARYPVEAVATEDSVLLEIGGEEILRRFREDARLAPAMVASLSMRFVSLVERVEELSLESGTRLARWLLRQPSHASMPAAIDLPLAKKDLAAHLAMTPETLSRHLHRWQTRGWIDSGRTRIVVRQPEPLMQLASGIPDPA